MAKYLVKKTWKQTALGWIAGLISAVVTVLLL